MASQPEDIEHYFKQRFSDVKDHSVSPSDQWEAFEAAFNAASTGGEAAPKPAFSAIRAVGIAASAAMVVGISAYVFFSAPNPSAEFTVPSVDIPHATPLPGTEPAPAFENAPLAAPQSGTLPKAVAELNDDKHGASMAATRRVGPADDGAIASTIIPTEIVQALEMIQQNEKELATVALDKKAGTGSEKSIVRQNISRISLIAPFKRNKRIEGEERIFPLEKPTRWSARNFAYAKAGIRTFVGQEMGDVPINLHIGFGLGYRLNTKWSIAAEAILSRKSGLELERVKDHRIFNINQVTLNPSDVAPSKFIVQQSFIATRVDVLQVPVLINYSLDHGGQWTIGGGAFIEYILRADNDIFFVYDGLYASTLGIGDQETLEGLNRQRFGILGSAEYQWKDRVKLSLRGLALLSTAYVEEGGLHAARPNSIPVDVQVGAQYLLFH